MADEHLAAMYGSATDAPKKEQKIFTTTSSSFVTIIIDGTPVKVPSADYVASLETQIRDLKAEVTVLSTKVKNLNIKMNNSAIGISALKKDVRTLSKPSTPREDF